ncbi:MAG: MCE family protein [Bacteroidia bacterium]|nr:MCE family protein [Bacteroidia bacterium]
MKISNETKVGVIAAFAIVILILGFNFLKGESIFSRTNTYYAVYQEVDGLFRSNPVVLNGYKVGHVNSVEMDHENLNLIVSVQIPSSIKLPRNTILKITNNDLLGSKAVEIQMGDSSVLAQHGDTLISRKDAGMAQAVTSVLSPLSEKVNNILIDLDTALTDVSLNSTLAELSDALRAFKQTATKMNAILEGKGEKLDGIFDNIDHMTNDLKSSTPKVKEIIANLETTSAEISKLELQTMGEELTKTIGEINATLKSIQEGQGSLGKLATDDALWNNLNQATHNLDSLVNDIIKYPRRYTGITEGQRKKGDRQKEVNEGIDLPTETKDK